MHVRKQPDKSVPLGCLGLSDADDDYDCHRLSFCYCLPWNSSPWSALINTRLQIFTRYKTDEVTQHSPRCLLQRFPFRLRCHSSVSQSSQSVDQSVKRPPVWPLLYLRGKDLPAATAGPKPHQHSSHTHSFSPSYRPGPPVLSSLPRVQTPNDPLPPATCDVKPRCGRPQTFTLPPDGPPVELS